MVRGRGVAFVNNVVKKGGTGLWIILILQCLNWIM